MRACADTYDLKKFHTGLLDDGHDSQYVPQSSKTALPKQDPKTQKFPHHLYWVALNPGRIEVTIVWFVVVSL